MAVRKTTTKKAPAKKPTKTTTRKRPVKKPVEKVEVEPTEEDEDVEMEGRDYWINTKVHICENGYEIEYEGSIDTTELERIGKEEAEKVHELKKDFSLPPKKDSIQEQAHLFITQMINSRKTTMDSGEALQLQHYYNTIFSLNEKVANCDICAIRMFKRLKNYLGIK